MNENEASRVFLTDDEAAPSGPDHATVERIDRRRFFENHDQMFNNPVLPTHGVEDGRLKVNGLVERPFAWTLDEIEHHEPLHAFITRSCISNPIAGH